jgi:hypothetical protein
LVSSAVAWLILAGFVLGRFASDVLPTHFLGRPMAAAALVAIVIGLVAMSSGRWAITIASLGAIGIALPATIPVILGAIISIVLLRRTRLLKRPLMLPEAVGKIAPPVAIAMFLVGAFNGISAIAPSPSAPPVVEQIVGPSMYLVLLDGYPRADTLREELGFDNEPFLAQLRELGFDVYDDAYSPRVWTELTLLSMFAGTTANVPHEAVTESEKRAIRERLNEAPLPRRTMELGYEFVVIDSPIGHVTFGIGDHRYAGGVNSLEDWLLRRSVFGHVIRVVAPYAVTDSLRSHLQGSLRELSDLAQPDGNRLVLAHIMAPHLPLLYDAEGSPLPAPPYWPEVMIFASTVEEMGIELDYVRAGYSGHLLTINEMVLTTVEQLVADDPDGVVVLFSDHGARFSYAQPEEWTLSFLAARTPGQRQLFADEPAPHAILCRLIVYYLNASCR